MMSMRTLPRYGQVSHCAKGDQLIVRDQVLHCSASTGPVLPEWERFTHPVSLTLPKTVDASVML